MNKLMTRTKKEIEKINIMRFRLLSVRTANIIANCIIDSVTWKVGVGGCEIIKIDLPKILEAYESGYFDPRSKKSYRNCGWKTFCEVAEFLEKPKPIKNSSSGRICKHCGKVVE
jgi:hypothetical protein